MIRGAWSFLSAEIRGLQAAAYVLALSALLSSLLALLRDRLFAHAFGAGPELDLYYAAFRIPDFLFVATGALVSVYVLIPELARRSEVEKRAYIDSVLVAFSTLAVAACTLAALLAPFLLAQLFPDFKEDATFPTLVALTQIMLLQPILLGISNILAAITQSKHRYTLYSVSPLLYNVGIISGLLVFYPFLGLPGLAWGVVFGALLHLSVQLPSIISDGFFHRIPIIQDVRGLLRTAAVSVPRALTLSMNQIAFTGLTAIASSLSSGSIAVFVFAYNLQAVPLSIIGASYSVAAFPSLASALSEGKHDEFIRHLAAAARYIFFWSLPISALILILRAHVVRVILGSGLFDWTDTRLTAALFALMALSLSAQSIALLIARAYYAAGRTFVPFFIGAFSAVATIALAVIFIDLFKDPQTLLVAQTLFRLQDVSGSSVLALAISYGLVSIVGTLVLVAHFEYRFGGFLSAVRQTFFHSLLAALCAGFACYFALTLVGPLTFSSTLASVLLHGAVGGFVGIVAAALVYAFLNNEEFFETITGLRSRLPRTSLPESVVTSTEESITAGPQ